MMTIRRMMTMMMSELSGEKQLQSLKLLNNVLPPFGQTGGRAFSKKILING